MDYFDPFAEPDALAAIEARPVNWLVLSFDTDWRFSTGHSRRIVRKLESAAQRVSFREIPSPWGHDSFLLKVDRYHATLRAFLDRALEVGL
jgi:homoserine O-acetyltransferase